MRGPTPPNNGGENNNTEPNQPKGEKKTRSMAEIRIGSRSRRETGTARPPGQRSHFLSHFLHCALVDRLIDSAASANDPLAPFRRPRFIVRSIRYEKKKTHTHTKKTVRLQSAPTEEKGGVAAVSNGHRNRIIQQSITLESCNQ